MSRYRVSMDIGGTFTDVVAYDEDTGAYAAGKASTTPGDLTEGVFAGLDQVVESPADIGFTVHGTTQGLNAFLQRRGERVLLLATQGAGDVYHIARGNRTRLYDIHYRKPAPLVPRGDIVEIGGRLDSAGAELEPLDEDAIRAAARRARDEGFGAVAVAFLFTYVNPAHELRAEEILREELDGDHRLALAPGRARVARVRAHLLGGDRRLHRARSCAATSSGSRPSCGTRGLARAAARHAVERRHRHRRVGARAVAADAALGPGRRHDGRRRAGPAARPAAT